MQEALKIQRSGYSLERAILLVFLPKHIQVSVKKYQSQWTSYPGVLALDGRLYFFKEFPVSIRQKDRKSEVLSRPLGITDTKDYVKYAFLQVSNIKEECNTCSIRLCHLQPKVKLSNFKNKFQRSYQLTPCLSCNNTADYACKNIFKQANETLCLISTVQH